MSRTTDRAVAPGDGDGAVAGPAERPLAARSVIASTLLGMRPSRLPTAILVRSCALFGITEGTTRVAISRMVAAGELQPDDGGYRLIGRLLDRQDRQDESRYARSEAQVGGWDGRWTMAVVVADRRSAADRNELRTAAGQLRLVGLREGVWIRPDNLASDRLPGARAVVEGQCRVFAAELTGRDRPGDAADLAASLWDLEAWSTRAVDLQRRIGALVDSLEAGDLDALAPGFVASAAVLRHFQADPLLPAELLPPSWPGPALRSDYDRYDTAFKRVWRAWYHAQAAP